jgi:hypothetical protein
MTQSEQLQMSLRGHLGIQKIVSGGQTGVDRAALDCAMALGLPHGGWCPRGRLAEDGVIPPEYCLQELDSAKYSDRTKRNVLDSDATLVLVCGNPEGGTLLTMNFASRSQKPCLKVRLSRSTRVERVRAWIVQNQIRVLNIAGPRASKQPEIHSLAFAFLTSLLRSPE